MEFRASLSRGLIMSFTLRDLPVRERPRERLQNLGASSLSIQELFEIILGCGGRSGSVKKITQDIISAYHNLSDLDRAPVGEMCKIKGVGQAKAVQIKAAVELGRRLHAENLQVSGPSILTSLDAYNLAAHYLKNKKKEHLLLFCLDVHGRIIDTPETVSIGVLDCSLLHPREIFNVAVRLCAAKIILAHNHPSGNSEPSLQDIEATKQTYQASKIMGMELLDHIVVGEGEYHSIHQDHPEVFV